MSICDNKFGASLTEHARVVIYDCNTGHWHQSSHRQKENRHLLLSFSFTSKLDVNVKCIGCSEKLHHLHNYNRTEATSNKSSLLLNIQMENTQTWQQFTIYNEY